MMVVDSKKDRVLTQKEILEVVGNNIGFGDGDRDIIMKRCLLFINNKDKEFLQKGNTLFVTSYSKNTADLQVFTADSARNFVSNCIEYFEHVRNKGVVTYTAVIEGSLVRVISIFKRYAVKMGARIGQCQINPQKQLIIVYVNNVTATTERAHA